MIRQPLWTLGADAAQEMDEHIDRGMDALRDLAWRDGPRPLMERLRYWYRYGQWCRETLELAQQDLQQARWENDVLKARLLCDRITESCRTVTAMRDVGRKITIREITDRLGITPMSVYTWREGSPVRDPLRCHTIPHGKHRRILFDEIDLIMFLVRYGLTDLLAKWCETRERAKEYEGAIEDDADDPPNDAEQPRLEGGGLGRD